MDSAIKSLAHRLQDLHSLYNHLECYYSQLPLTIRRYLYGSNASPIDHVHQVAEAKFILAALLTWNPTAFQFNFHQFLAEGGSALTRVKSEWPIDCADDELCPIWTDFFADIAAADRLISPSMLDPTYSLPNTAYAEMLVSQAEVKYTWVLELYNIVRIHGDYVSTPGYNTLDLTGSMIYKGWNRFCAKIAFRAVSLRDAVRRIRQLGQSPPSDQFELTYGASYRREYFRFVPGTSFQPWSALSHNSITHPTNGTLHRAESLNVMLRTPPQETATVGTASRSPEPVSRPTKVDRTLQAYNNLWESIMERPNDPHIPFPTATFLLEDMVDNHGTGLPAGVAAKQSVSRCVELKTCIFFLNGLGFEWRIERDPTQGIKVVPKLREDDHQRYQLLLKQLRCERDRWDSKALSMRTGRPDYVEEKLGSDWVSVAIRQAVYDLEQLVKAKINVI